MIVLQAAQRLLERAVTAARAESPRVTTLLHELDGRNLVVTISGTPLQLAITCRGESLLLSSTIPADVDASLTGPPLTLLALARTGDQSAMQRGAVQIEGDAQIAQRFRELLLQLRPDVEHLLSGPLGRSAAHVLMGAVRHTADWGRQAADTQLHNVAEYLAHETGDLVSRPEGDDFMHSVERLREQLDRSDARLHALEQRCGSLAGEPEPG